MTQQLNYGTICNNPIQPYKNPSDVDLSNSHLVKDLGVITNSNLTFREHIKSIITASRIKIDMILRTFLTRDVEIMIRLFKTYNRSKLEYCCSV